MDKRILGNQVQAVEDGMYSYILLQDDVLKTCVPIYSLLGRLQSD